jgi:hypothetical protein
MYEPTVEQSTMQLILDQVEELLVTIVNEIRQRPGVALALLAAVTGALVGSMLAARTSRRHQSPARGVVRKARGVGEAADLAALGVKLLQNPIVRSYVRSAIEGQLKKRFSM